MSPWLQINGFTGENQKGFPSCKEKAGTMERKTLMSDMCWKSTLPTFSKSNLDKSPNFLHLYNKIHKRINFRDVVRLDKKHAHSVSFTQSAIHFLNVCVPSTLFSTWKALLRKPDIIPAPMELKVQ